MASKTRPRKGSTRGRSPGKRRNVTLDVWKVARLFMRDVRAHLLPEHCDLIEGLIRARSLASLADVQSRLGFEYLDPYPKGVLSQIEAFFSKNASFADDDRCKAAAEAKFYEAEEQCAETNARLVEFYENEPRMHEASEGWETSLLVDRMRKSISKLLGPTDTFLRQVPWRIKITSGATSNQPRARSQPYRKVRKRLSVTAGCQPYLEALYKHAGIQPRENSFEIVQCNRVALVPKNWKTHRTIAAEPEGNLLFQLAVDSFCKERLLSHGINLSSQETNQLYAKESSKTDHLATVDLAMASDTTSLEIVPFLFPESWTKILCDLRTPCYKGVYGVGVWHKFSSMGNGFTFPLETIIFWAAAKAVGSKVVSVYGDDIVVDADKYHALEALLSFLGFRVNEEKSFHQGPFRESCGGDYFRGVNIRPFFIRKSVNLGKSELCHNVNGLASIAPPDGELEGFLAEQVKTNRLPLVPWNESSTSGVHLYPGDAYSLKKVREHPARPKSQIYGFFGYVGEEQTKRVADLRSMILWFVMKRRNPFSKGVALASVVSTGLTKVRYRWTAWRVPVTRPPDHLLWWSDRLLRES